MKSIYKNKPVAADEKIKALATNPDAVALVNKLKELNELGLCIEHETGLLSPESVLQICTEESGIEAALFQSKDHTKTVHVRRMLMAAAYVYCNTDTWLLRSLRKFLGCHGTTAQNAIKKLQIGLEKYPAQLAVFHKIVLRCEKKSGNRLSSYNPVTGLDDIKKAKVEVRQLSSSSRWALPANTVKTIPFRSFEWFKNDNRIKHVIAYARDQAGIFSFSVTNWNVDKMTYLLQHQGFRFVEDSYPSLLSLTKECDTCPFRFTCPDTIKTALFCPKKTKVAVGEYVYSTSIQSTIGAIRNN